MRQWFRFWLPNSSAESNEARSTSNLELPPAPGHGDLGAVPLLRQAFGRLILFETRYGVPSEMGAFVRIGVRLHATIPESS